MKARIIRGRGRMMQRCHGEDKLRHVKGMRKGIQKKGNPGGRKGGERPEFRVFLH
jgi:hypothetical protein